MLARLIATRVIAKAVLITVLSSLVVSIPAEMAWAAKRKPIPPGSCLISHRHVVANSGACMANCNSLGWCMNMVCMNGQLSLLPLPCHRPEACPAIAC